MRRTSYLRCLEKVETRLREKHTYLVLADGQTVALKKDPFPALRVVMYYIDRAAADANDKQDLTREHPDNIKTLVELYAQAVPQSTWAGIDHSAHLCSQWLLESEGR